MGRLLLLIPTSSYRVGDFLRAAHQLGVGVAVASNRGQVLEKYSKGQTVKVSFSDLGRGVQQIVAYARRYPLEAIVPVDEETTLLAAKASKAPGLPHNSVESVEAAHNKYRFRTLLSAAGLSSPQFQLLSIRCDPVRAAAATIYPCVLKPLALSASRGVIRVDDPEAFVAAFHRIANILKQPDTATNRRSANHILVESYIPGVEVALEALLDSGRINPLALFDKPDPLEGPFFEETIYVTPSRLSSRIQETVIATVAQAVPALGLSDGPIHAELRINDQGTWIIELAARSIGGLCSRTLRFGAGVALEELILRHALRLPIASLERERCAAGVMMIPVPQRGKLCDIHGLEAARSVASIADIAISIPVGHEVVPLPEGYRYLGFIFAKADDPGAVEAALREAHRQLRFTIDPAAQIEG